jgi:hypothetical protein
MTMFQPLSTRLSEIEDQEIWADLFFSEVVKAIQIANLG